MNPIIITIAKYAAFGCQVGVVLCGLGLFIWHLNRMVRGIS
jgi:hypothetical protein